SCGDVGGFGLPGNRVAGASDADGQRVVVALNGAHGQRVEQLRVQGPVVEVEHQVGDARPKVVHAHVAPRGAPGRGRTPEPDGAIITGGGTVTMRIGGANKTAHGEWPVGCSLLGGATGRKLRASDRQPTRRSVTSRRQSARTGCRTGRRSSSRWPGR